MENIKLTIFDDATFTGYSFEMAMKKMFEKNNYRLLSMNFKKFQEKYVFKKLNLIDIDLTIEDTGTEIRDLSDLDQFESLADIIIEELENNLSLQFYGIE